MCLQSNPKYRPNAADLLYHPFFNEYSNSYTNGNGQKSSIYIELANEIAGEVDQSKLDQFINENQEKILCSSKLISEIANQYILFEVIALFSEEINNHLMPAIIENLLKVDDK